VYATNLADGKQIWQSDYLGEEFEAIYNNHPFNGKAVGADGKLYYSTDTTYRMMPRLRFNRLVAIDEATGKFLWVLPIQISPSAIANGYLIGADTDNGIQYAIGKGQTKTDVSIQNNVVAEGSSALITGTVMDLSPAQPNTPAISDADMSVWMDYLNGQNATLLNSPPSVRGVDVKLTAVSATGNIIDLGTVASDSGGHFTQLWKPTDTGLYTVYATFTGSESYFSSFGETALGVEASTETTTPTTPETTVNNSEIVMYVVAAAIAIIIAIAIVGALVLRKHS
jgi:hypothetical protein